MASFATLAIADVLVPERLREVDEDQALILSTQMAEQGLINPITVRKTPPATKPYRKYMLVAGAHRLAAARMLRWSEIDAMVVQADAAEALVMEISENLIRHELTALDRAIFVSKYREAWEAVHGEVSRQFRRSDKLSERNAGMTRPDKSGFPATSILDAVEAMEGSTFFEDAALRLGIHPRSVERANFIAQHLVPELRRELRGRPEADNQSALIRIARLEPTRQRDMVTAMTTPPAGSTGTVAPKLPDVSAALAITDPNAKAVSDRTEQDKIFETLVAAWERTDAKTRERFLVHAAKPRKRERLPSVSEVLAVADVDPRQITIFELITKAKGAAE